jgi:hypothetical protein
MASIKQDHSIWVEVALMLVLPLLSPGAQGWPWAGLMVKTMLMACAVYFGALSGLCAPLGLPVMIKRVCLSILTVCLLISCLDDLMC